MNGTVRLKRPPDYWEIRVDAGRDPVTKRRRQKSKGFRGTKAEAHKALRTMCSEVDAGRTAGTDGTLGHLLERWLEHAGPDWSPATVVNVKLGIAAHITPTLGAVPLSKLDAGRLDKLYADLRAEGLAPASVRKVHAIIRRALAQALRWGWITTNVATAASPPRVPKPELSPPSPDQVRAVIAKAAKANPGKAKAVPMLADFLRVAAKTGARRGEISGIRRSDIDAEAQTLTISRAIVDVGSTRVVKDTKTHQQRRIALGPDVVDLLLARLDHQAAEAAKGGFSMDPDPFVFSDAIDGATPPSPASFTRAFRRLANSLGYKNVRLHDSRHMHATRLLDAGVSVRQVAGRLGHANAATTLNIYAHFLPVSDRDSARIIGEVLADPAVVE